MKCMVRRVDKIFYSHSRLSSFWPRYKKKGTHACAHWERVCCVIYTYRVFSFWHINKRERKKNEFRIRLLRMIWSPPPPSSSSFTIHMPFMRHVYSEYMYSILCVHKVILVVLLFCEIHTHTRSMYQKVNIYLRLRLCAHAETWNLSVFIE